MDAVGAVGVRRGGLLDVTLEEAVLDLEVRSARVPGAFLDVTVRHGVPGELVRLTAAARSAGSVCREAEADKRRRYPDGQAPWQVVPFAVETYGRLGVAALKHLRELARARAQSFAESGDEAASALVRTWAARISVGLHRSNAARLRSALGQTELTKRRREDVAAELAG